MGRSVNQDVMLADLDVLSADDHCRMAHMPASMRGVQLPRPLLHCTRAMTCVRLSLTSHCLLHMHRITWELLLEKGLHTRDGWYSFARTCHDTALSHCVHPEAALTQTDPVIVGGSERATCKDIRSGSSASAAVRRGLRQPTHELYGGPCETAQHRRRRYVTLL